MTPNRMFNPRTGRWTSPDPFFHMRFGSARIMGSPNAIAQSGNLFAFTMNNPVRWVDPTGLFAQPPTMDLCCAWIPPTTTRQPTTSSSNQSNSGGGSSASGASGGGGQFITLPTPGDCGGSGNPVMRTLFTWRRRNLDEFSDPVTRIVLHHTVTGATARDPITGRVTTAGLVRAIDRDHRNRMGWPGVGYHFLIAYEGTIYRGRPLNYQGNHARFGYSQSGQTIDRNPFTIGIAVIGTFNNDNVPTQAQLDSLGWLIEFVMSQIPAIDTVERHWGDDRYFNYLGPWANEFTRRP